MKKIISYCLLLIATTTVFVSCRDEEKDPWADFRSPNGSVISWTAINSSIINFADINNSAYDVDLTDISGNVAEYELSIVYKGDSAVFETITSFPAKLTITAAELVTALNAAGRTIADAGAPGGQRAYVITDFLAGDRVDCFATVTDKKGNVFPVTRIGNDLLTNPGMRTMHRFNFFFSCPFDATEAAGTYFVTFDGWGDYPSNGTVPVEVTSTANSVTLNLYSDAWIGVANHKDYPVTITVNTANGVATVAAQQAYDTGWWPGAFGIASVDGAGFVFSCSGTITVDLQHRVAAGTFGGGPYNITLQKNP
jgi:hypothetical protein